MKIELTKNEYFPFMGIIYKTIKAIALADGSSLSEKEMMNAIKKSKMISIKKSKAISISIDSTEEDSYVISLNEKMITSMYGITDKYLPIFISQITALVITAKQYTGEMDTEMKSIMDFLEGEKPKAESKTK